MVVPVIRIRCHVCGWTREYAGDVIGSDRCPCGSAQVAHVEAPAPRFRGACRGPLAETTRVEGFREKLVEATLTLKKES